MMRVLINPDFKTRVIDLETFTINSVVLGIFLLSKN